MAKLDLKKELKHLYGVSRKEAVEVDVPALNYLMVDGEGDPNSSKEYTHAIEALFSVSYTAKFMLKKGPESLDYTVMPLEGLWWADDLSAFVTNERANWKWTMMIVQPTFVSAEVVAKAVAAVRQKRDLPAIDSLQLKTFHEGRCAQILHIGPFTDEGPTVEKLHKFIECRGSLAGRHHEIYLSDIRRAKPEKWKTIIRQPMQ